MANSPDDRPPSSPDEPTPRAARPFGLNMLLLILAVGLFVAIFFASSNSSRSELPYPVFEQQIKLPEPNILRLEIGETQAFGVFKEPPEIADEYDESGKKITYWDKAKNQRQKYGKKFYVNLPRNDTSREELLDRLRENDIDYRLLSSGGGALEILWLLACLL